MYFIEVIEINEDGSIKESKVVNKETFEETEFTKFQWEGYFLKPKWSFTLNKWIETATEEELNPPEIEEELTEVEELGQKISEMELADLEKENRIKQLEAENEVLGMQQTENDLRLMELEDKLNGTF